MNPQAISAVSTFEMETKISINIHASPEKIMALLTDAPNFTRWNSTIVSIEGEIEQGKTIKLISKLDPKRTFKLKVLESSPNKMVWKDGFAPMFTGVRTFSLSPKADGTTDFTMSEVFKGLMLPLIKGSLPDFKPNFEQYASDLKKATE
ncbi:MAG: SRPBCC domain-containing protein [Raineya sp.]|jgi:hypothetical protein|nr:SRPBCC domain-containing protein [Raineya sp.]